ncbi:prolyl oligopeptidase family protein [Hirsutella rhossiliensis]|uniref:Prolyl oligopeptidase family domain-containing protein n=1 Tax=Hirsutella rhossiliensis TaxID=111463 RepID=A0A9P8MW02_9HYPO|nr:prolyl oligopeptidase family domain-containing protein [Hirsutella rhossiliensis]KAH0962290.1 prolyl oligopeptidase family domain-containing protein [Hirsutella rhossiliensis]
MTVKTIARHGDWPSPIGVDDIASKTRALAAPRVTPHSGRAFFRETTEDGRSTIVEVTADGGIVEVLPAPYSVSNRVYEYGASLYNVLPDDAIVFSHQDDAVYVLDPDARSVTFLTKGFEQRYASFSASPVPSSSWVLAIQEDHAYGDTPEEVRNSIVAINTDTGEVKTVVSGADFYFVPRFSPDGASLSWLEWNRPDMMFDAAKLYRAHWALSDDGSICNVRCISGAGREGVAEPHWGPDGSLFFAREDGPYRQLVRVAAGSDTPVPIKLLGLEKAEIGVIGLSEGSQTILPLSEDWLVVSAVLNGISRLIAVDLETNEWRQLADAQVLSHISGDAMARLDNSSFLVIGSGTTSPHAVHRFHLTRPERNRVIREATDLKLPKPLLSEPEPVHIRSKESPTRDIFGFLWMPRNPDFSAPQGELPPLIVVAHGGPTGRAGSGLNLRTQYFTSRGYAVVELNYSGSTGYGRDYRNALFGRWGILDADDAAECAARFVAAGRVRAGAVGITGISAGGYNTLQVLVRHSDEFAAGFCVSGVGDLERFDATTHKLEADYTPALVLPRGGTDDEGRVRIYHERSALHHVDDITSPLVLLHGQADTVVPVEQATLVGEALKDRRADVKLIVVEGEGHMMDKPESTRIWLEEEEKLWRRTLL